jgi:hypothetical protein
VLRANVDEMNVEAVDLGDEIRHGIQLRSALRQSYSVAQ